MNYFLLFSLFIMVFLSYYIIFSKNTLHSIILLFIILILMGTFYLLMGSFFLFVSHIFIYAGGTIVLLIFAINTDHLKKIKDIKFKETLISFFIAFLIYFFILNVLKKYPFPKKFVSFKMEFIFELLLKDYVTLFILTSLFLLIGFIGTFMIMREK